MDKFWEWMYKKGYAEDDQNKDCLTIKDKNNKNIYSIETPKQMLIGYMIEYILQYCPVHSLFIPDSTSTTTILSYYNYLKWFIEEELGKKRKD